MTVKVADAAGVAVYEMPVEGEVRNDALLALAEEAMKAAATTVTPEDLTTRDLHAHFHGPIAGKTLRAEAIVMRKAGATVRVAADILAGGRCVASFEADALAAA